MKFRVEKNLKCTLTLVYEIEAEDKYTAIEIVQADDGRLEPISEETNLDSDPQDSYTAEAVKTV